MRCSGAVLLAMLAATSVSVGQETGLWTSGPKEDYFQAANSMASGEAAFICRNGRFSANYTVSLQDLPPMLTGATSAGVGLDIDGEAQALTVKNLALEGYVYGAVTFGGQRAIDWAKKAAMAEEHIDFFLLDSNDQPSNVTAYPAEGAADAIAAVLEDCGLE